MKVEQIYTGCLAQGAYYIESNGEAAIIAPLRETQPYIDRAAQDGADIKYILETHFHADFVSGHLDLARKPGAQIVYGPEANPQFEIYKAKDDEFIQLGNVKIQVLHTPGHTPESSCYLLFDEDDKPYAVFTGDTLFIGDVGRPDLAQKPGKVTQEDLAGWLYDSLRNKIMTLPDDVILYPGHGAGSACGKHMSDETVSTIGSQKETNYALRANMTKDEFIKEVTEGLLPPPQYFPKNAMLNKQGYESYDEVLERGTQALDPQAFEDMANELGALVLDVRDKEEFAKGFIPKSIFIGLGGDFAPWVGTLIPELNQPILLVTPEGSEEEAVTRLSRVGYDNAVGYLKGGFEAWKKAGKQVDAMEAKDAEGMTTLLDTRPDIQILDVRKPGEWDKSHLAGAQHLPLDYINQHMHEIEPEKNYALHCKGGYRATIAGSILKSRGYNNITVMQDKYDNLAEKRDLVGTLCED
jgi:glyoxylase-like metal-dependent hydrolase (beta-lactamase superfamily II)/rhodanese-related sulfurtransferase